MTSVVADTNIFLRYLTNDIPEQADRIAKRFADAKAGKLTVVVLHITIIEILFHLERWYHLSKADATGKLLILLSQPWIDVEEKPVVLTALRRYESVTIDVVDVLTGTIAQRRRCKVLSFDRDFEKLSKGLTLKP